MKGKLKYILLVIGAGCFVYLILNFGLQNILLNVRKTGWLFIPIVLVWFPVYLFNAIAWKFIINRRDLPYFRLLLITISGYALNYLTPFFNLGGEPYRVIALKERLGINKAVSVTLSYLMLHFLSSFLLWISAVVIILFHPAIPRMIIYLLAISLFVFLYVVRLFFKGYKHGVTKYFARILVRLPLLKKFSGEISSREQVLTEIDDYTTELFLHRKGDFIAAICFEYFSRIVATIEFYLILISIGLTPTFIDALMINAAYGLINNLFFIIPFELGIKEGGMYAIIGMLNYTPELGIYVSLVLRLRELGWIIVGLAVIPLSRYLDKTKSYSAENANENITI